MSAPAVASGAAANTRRIFKLFAGNLPWTMGSKELKLYFSKFGHVAHATVVYDHKVGMSQGYGFVVFSNAHGYNSALNLSEHVTEGRVIKVVSSTS